MFKKLLFIGGTVAIGSMLLFGTAAFSHVSHGVSWMRGQVQENVPVEYELDRARNLIEESAPQIRECKRVIAEKQVEIRYLRNEIADLEGQADSADTKLAVTHSAMKSNRSVVVSNRRLGQRDLVKLASRQLERAQAMRNMLQSKQQRLGALENTLTAAQRTFEELQSNRQNLIELVQTLEAKRQETEAKKAMTLDLDVDDSKLAKAKAILENVQKRLDVEMQIMDNNAPMFDDVPEIEVSGASMTEKISAYLQLDETEVEAASETVSNR